MSNNNRGKMILVVQHYRHGVRAHIHTEDERLAAAKKEHLCRLVSVRKNRAVTDV